MYIKYEYMIGGSVMKPLDESQKPLTRDAIKYIAMFTMLLNHRNSSKISHRYKNFT